MQWYFAPIEAGVESSIDDDGVRANRPAEATGLITLPIHRPPATIDPRLLRDVPLTAMATLGMRLGTGGASLEGESCAFPRPVGGSCQRASPEARSG